jgi:DNA-binding NtrC family response regulator
VASTQEFRSGGAAEEPDAPAPPRHEPGKTLDEIEMDYILYTLKAANNDRKKAAHMLGISLRTLYNDWRGRRTGCVPTQQGRRE